MPVFKSVLKYCKALIILNWSVHNDTHTHTHTHTEALKLILQNQPVYLILHLHFPARFQLDSDVICYECAGLRVESTFVSRISVFLNI